MKKYKVLFCMLCMSACLVACGNVKEDGLGQEVVIEKPREVEKDSFPASAEDNPLEEMPTTIAEETGGSLQETELQETYIEEEKEMDAGQLTITFIGHASLKLESSDGTVIYVDPNYTWDYSAAADFILVTHGHGDHLPRPEVTLKENGKKIYYTEALHNGVYEVYDYGNVRIEAVAAGGNPNHDINVCVGYLITVDGYTIYHAGDTSKIAEMEKLSDRVIDYAFYPIDGVYNMDAVEATEAATIVGALHNIPIHALDDNHTGKADAFTPDGKMIIEQGESIVLPVK